ncbi:sugar diacid recognition domain-containing protein, partial [Klebsiella pneumoniae]
MIITTALANEIVARAMAIIHHNVNVIDHHGQIIASGERHRIGEQHEVDWQSRLPNNSSPFYSTM